MHYLQLTLLLKQSDTDVFIQWLFPALFVGMDMCVHRRSMLLQ